MKNPAQLSILIIGLVISVNAHGDISRTPDGKPDLSGIYNIATVTPIERPEVLGNIKTLTEEKALALEAQVAAVKAAGLENSDPNRVAPPEGGDGSPGAAGNVGGYNFFWIDAGDTAIKIDGEYRTSVIIDPPNGRFPRLTERAQAKTTKVFTRTLHENKGDAWWLNQDGAGPYDDPETLTLSDRCLISFGSSSGPPMLPALYNNMKRIVQTPDYVVILNEMVHDARVIRLNSEHGDSSIRKWLGDSIGWWEGDTLVVDTVNFVSEFCHLICPQELSSDGGGEDLHVVERFTRTDENTLLYSFTVEDPNSWSEPWSGEYPWPKSKDRVFEYACHEGNYAMEGILKGARLLEKEAVAAENAGG
jgi:hypothetical protein